MKESFRDRCRRRWRDFKAWWCKLAHRHHHDQYWTECTRYFWKCKKCQRPWSTPRDHTGF